MKERSQAAPAGPELGGPDLPPEHPNWEEVRGQSSSSAAGCLPMFLICRLALAIHWLQAGPECPSAAGWIWK